MAGSLRAVISQDLTIDGPDRLMVPGSDIMMGALGRLVLLLGLLVLVIALVVRTVRRRRDPQWRRRPGVVIAATGTVVVGALLTALYWPPPFVVPTFPALPQLLPAEAFFYRPVTDLPVAAESDRWIASQGGLRLGAGFGGAVQDGVVFGLPFNLVDADTTMVDVELTQYPEASYPGPYPIAEPTYIEGLPLYHIDQHYLAVDVTARTGWELIAARDWFGRWQAGSGARWNMDSVDYPEGSTMAAGLPLLPGTITYAEVEAGTVDHVLLGATSVSARGKFVWPARGGDGISDDPTAPPMGTWMRLRNDADLSGLGPQATVIARAAQQYGILLSDTGPGFGLRGTPDRRWDDTDLGTLAGLTTDDFEFVDTSEVMVSATTMAANPPA